MGEMKNAFILAGKPGGKSHSEAQGLGGRIILKINLKQVDRGGGGLKSCGSGRGPVAVSCE
jgi:hypothetical protein